MRIKSYCEGLVAAVQTRKQLEAELVPGGLRQTSWRIIFKLLNLGGYRRETLKPVLG